MTFDHPNIKRASVDMVTNPGGDIYRELTLSIDVDERANTKEAQEIEGMAQKWLRSNPSGKVRFDHL